MISFTYDHFCKLCYLPYNTILTSFMAHGLDVKGMREEQAREVEHRARKLRAHRELEQDTWGAFNAWVDKAEVWLIDQVQAHVENGNLLPARVATDAEPIAWMICRMLAPPMGEWKALPVHPHCIDDPVAGRVVSIAPDGMRS